MNRFWSKVDKSGDCWLWTAAKSRQGYGLFRVKKMERAHRVAWALTNGPVPCGLFVLHKCDNRGCVRPDHLFLGDNSANMADMVEKGRSAKGVAHGCAKLDPSRVAAIKELYAKGNLSQIKVGAIFGISQSQVGNIVNGHKWAHL